MLKYFRKIINSFSMGLLWLMVASISGLYFGLALFSDSMHWYNIVFYGCFALSFAGLLWYFYRVWR